MEVEGEEDDDMEGEEEEEVEEEEEEDKDKSAMPPPPPPPLPRSRQVNNLFGKKLRKLTRAVKIGGRSHNGGGGGIYNVDGLEDEEEDGGRCPSELMDFGGVETDGDGLSQSEEEEGNHWYIEEDDGSDSQEEEEDVDNNDEDEEMDENEIDSLLEEGLPKTKRITKKINLNFKEKLIRKGQGCSPGASARPRKELSVKKIMVLEEKGKNSLEVLPGGWIQIRHSSGLPIYLHRKSRVCTLAKPYFIGTASVRFHSVPLSGIPCLAYRKALEKEKIEEKEKLLIEQKNELESSTNCNRKQAEAEPPKEKRPPEVIFESILEKSKSIKRKTSSPTPKHERKCCSKAKMMKPDNANESRNLQSCNKNSNSDFTEDTDLEDNEGFTSTADIHQNEDSTAYIITESTNNEEMSATKTMLSLAKVENAKENASLNSVSPADLREYCKPLFKFSEVECRWFKTWKARRNHTKEQRRKSFERPTLPNSTQVIKFACNGNEQMAKKFKEYVFNPNGKSAVCILHEFVQQTLRKQPTYAFKELENAATPYSACVLINGTPYGVGYGSSKKVAKIEAAKTTLEVLIPEIKGHLSENGGSGSCGGGGGSRSSINSKMDSNNEFDVAEYFQQVEMDDVRIQKLCVSISEPSPYLLLLTCLQRNFGYLTSDNVKFEMLSSDLSKGKQSKQFQMSADQYTVTVNATSKKEGKQVASQLLLSKIHPHISNFGAFIKMYGNSSIKSAKEKKQEEQQITNLQSKAAAHSPNWAILNKLRSEMLKLAMEEQKEKEKAEEGDNRQRCN